ncbi:hypothetical protein XELAEV_18013526mg [Xenopus laevis]|uniref:Uncharacterized protein n=1 Tax=Xenopus laevis TaxID=8355 RepID=A0A974HZQ4_XENLA|nr:hypothetical protein XELAEV_18013526mg [Xenopus laevis]
MSRRLDQMVSEYIRSYGTEKIIKRFWPIFEVDTTLVRLCPQPPLFSYKKSQTLNDILCPAETYWPKRMESAVVQHPTIGNNIKLRHYATCDTTGVCSCGKVSVRQTFRQVKARIKEQRKDIKNFKPNTCTGTSVLRHFNWCRHNMLQLKWMVLEVIQEPQRGGNKKRLILQKEGRAIHKLPCKC